MEFADGKPLGKRGVYWLAIHLANCYGKDKVSFHDRIQWVRENEKELVEFARDPVKPHRFWTEADKPWSFLAACKEWSQYLTIGPDFQSHLPISMDGTCNGYQHLSAMGCDPIGGKATNLVPGSKPEDIYKEVAEQAKHRIEVAANKGSYDAQEWIGRIDRKIVKHATMTTPYGVTLGTIRKHLIDEGYAKHCRDPGAGAKYLAEVLEECIREVVVKAREIMDWLRDVAYTLAEANCGVCWTVPTGFVVFHESRRQKAVRLTTAERTLVVYEDSDSLEIAPEKQANGIVAHLVHSLDAAHMMLTVNRLHREGLQHFAVVHDSYGVHACGVDRLNRVLREEFVRIYLEPVLERFLEEQKKANPGVTLKEPPTQGELDVRQVLDSKYFFA